MSNKCPACKSLLPTGVTFCECGWRDKTVARTQPQLSSSAKCAYTTEGRRCRMGGSISFDRGEGSTYYCSWHYRALTNRTNTADKGAFTTFAQQKGALTPIDEVYKAKNLPLTNNQWRQDVEWLWKQVMAFV